MVNNSIATVTALLLGLTCGKVLGTSDLAAVRTIEDLDKIAVFSFAVMSDNNGDSPKNSTEFARMARWIEENSDKFVIGLGDHVVKGSQNSFLPFLAENKWWHDHFYPNVADHENEYYGVGQWDWGAGRKILDVVDLRSRKDVEIRPNGAEYYAKIPVRDYTVHLIQLSYPDEPEDPEEAFKPDSREYLIKTIQGIKKTDKDIIVACAHSCYGTWIHMLSKEERKIVMEKADLVLSATTHYFMRVPVLGYGDHGALCLNTGSITNPRFFSPPGYVQVHVLANPTRLVAQYILTDRDKRELQPSLYAWLKHVSGKIEPAPFRETERQDSAAAQ